MYTATGTIDVEQRITEFAPLVRRMAHHLAAKLPVLGADRRHHPGRADRTHGRRATASRRARATSSRPTRSQRIRGAMLDELRQNDWLPRSVRKSLRQIETAISKLEQRLGRAPTERELAAEMGVSLDAYQAMLQEARGTQLIHLGRLRPGGRRRLPRIALSRQPRQSRSNAFRTSASAPRWSRRSRAAGTRKAADGPVLRAGHELQGNRRRAGSQRIACLPAAQPGGRAPARRSSRTGSRRLRPAAHRLHVDTHQPHPTKARWTA